MSLYLGVDGGGTKTALALVSDEGAVVASATLPTCYYLASPLGVGLVSQVLTAGIAQVCREAAVRPADITFAFVGLPAYGEIASDVPALDEAARGALGHARFRCDNDVVAGWAGSLGAVDGIHVVAGTGSIAYAERAGARARAGGWGELFGDEGSGYWIGQQGLMLFSRMSDGRLSEGPLLHLVRDHLGLSRDLDLVDVVFRRWQGDRGRIAALSPLVVAAADAGDRHAAQLISQAGHHLAAHVLALRERVGYGDGETSPVSYSGGVFGAASVLAAFTASLAEAPVALDVRAPRLPPVLGAAAHAARLGGSPLGESALARLARATSSSAGRA